MFKQTIKLIVESKLVNTELLSNAVQGICKSTVKDDVLTYNLVLCLVEAVTNVIVHSYQRKPDEIVEVIISMDDHQIAFEVLDTGEPKDLPAPKTQLDFNPDDVTSLPESGMGIFLINQLMDEVTYGQNEEGKNFIKMTKFLEKTT